MISTLSSPATGRFDSAPTLPNDQELRNTIHRSNPADDTELREVFNDFVGQTFFGQMIKAMRTSVGKPAYFHGGRGEEVFQAQLDQQLAEEMSDATADSITGPMYDLFMLSRT